MLRLMCVTAHPDDEAGGFGGTLRLYHDRGVETYVVCVTSGQAASHRGGAKDDHELAAIRRRELAASCEILGVSRNIMLDYADSKLHRIDLNGAVAELTRLVRELRPHVMLTFGPEGAVTGHTDHSMVSVFTTLAFQWAGRSNRYPDQLNGGLQVWRPQKLYYTTATFTLPGRPPVCPAPPSAVLEIGSYVDTKIAAFRAHASQAPLFALFEQNIRGRGSQEMFHLAASSALGLMTQEADLFAGVKDEG